MPYHKPCFVTALRETLFKSIRNKLELIWVKIDTVNKCNLPKISVFQGKFIGEEIVLEQCQDVLVRNDYFLSKKKNVIVW